MCSCRGGAIGGPRRVQRHVRRARSISNPQGMIATTSGSAAARSATLRSRECAPAGATLAAGRRGGQSGQGPAVGSGPVPRGRWSVARVLRAAAVERVPGGRGARSNSARVVFVKALMPPPPGLTDSHPYAALAETLEPPDSVDPHSILPEPPQSPVPLRCFHPRAPTTEIVSHPSQGRKRQAPSTFR